MPLTKSQYNEIMRSYDQVSLMNRRIEAERLQEVKTAIPEYQDIDDAIADLSLSYARKLLTKSPDGTPIDKDALKRELNEEISSQSKKRIELLAAHGFPADYLEPIYGCPDCHDTGYIGASKCHCFMQKEIDLVYRQSNLNGILETQSLSDFSLSYYSKDPKDAVNHITPYEAAEKGLEVAKHFIEHFGEDPAENLFITGDAGMGKTFLSNCIAKELLDKGYPVLYFTALSFYDLLSDLIKKHDDDDETDPNELYENLLTCDLLILDDIGTEVSNSFTTSKFYQIINERLINNRSTIITTNLSLQLIRDVYSERVFSRVASNYTMVKLFGTDIRLLKKFNK